MTVLTQAVAVPNRSGTARRADPYPVAATLIYKGAMVCLNSSGYVVNAADTAGYSNVLGIAAETVDNSAGSAGDKTISVEVGVFQVAATSVTRAMTGTPLYVVDNATVDDAAGATNDIFAGIMVGYESTTLCWVLMGPAALQLSGVTASSAELNRLDGVTGSVVEAQAASFTETAGAGVYTGSVNVPAGATILDVIVNGVALWDNSGTASMDVGDVTDPNGYFAGINLKATDLLAGESISFESAGGKAGAYIANSQVSPRYSSSARVVSGIITTSSTGGTAGRTNMVVIYLLPQSTTAATKV